MNREQIHEQYEEDEKLREECGQTPKEFCEDIGGIEIGGMTQ